MKVGTYLDRRKSKRIDSKMGIILTSDGIYCKLVNLSKDGLSFKCIDSPGVPNEWSVNIHDVDIPSIEELKVEKVWKKQHANALVTTHITSIYSFEVGGIFKNLSSSQKSQINSYLRKLSKSDK